MSPLLEKAPSSQFWICHRKISSWLHLLSIILSNAPTRSVAGGPSEIGAICQLAETPIPKWPLHHPASTVGVCCLSAESRANSPSIQSKPDRVFVCSPCHHVQISEMCARDG